MTPKSKQRLVLIISGIILTLLLAAVFTLGSLDVPFEPQSWRVLLPLFAVSSFITAAALVFLLILIRSIFRLSLERSRQHLGARFKTKMVVGAMGISLLPILFMFFVSYSLLNRTLARWFPRPLEIAAEQSSALLNDLGRNELPRMKGLARESLLYSPYAADKFVSHALGAGADCTWLLDRAGNIEKGGALNAEQVDMRPAGQFAYSLARGAYSRTLPSGLELWGVDGHVCLSAREPIVDAGQTIGFIVAGKYTAPDILERYNEIERQTLAYDQEKQHLRILKRQLLLILSFFTVLLLSSVTWLALHLAKQVTVPIQALAEGTREVSTGNFDYQVPEQAQDELGILVRSFNAMTTQLRDSRAQIDQFTRSLQQAVQELERRRQLMETVLENIPTGVISLSPEEKILRANSAIPRIFGPRARDAQTLEDLVGPEDARIIQHLLRRSLRMGVVSREVEMVAGGRLMHAAVTVSSLGPRRANSGYVVVLDDLTELLHSQKSAAWQEVARRIAHEIKNPLTPIQLSAQRLSRHLEKRAASEAAAPRDPELTRLVQDCSRLIEREVSSLAQLVNEFSQFVRFPSAKLEPADANAIARQAVEVFSGRLDGITLNTSFATNLPPIRADESLLRSVLVNLIDNAAEALESSPVRAITVSTCTGADSENIEIRVEDTGHGISPEDKDKLFLPHFSTKGRGTGLGLAIAARIVAEHAGTIHVEDNFPVGSRFLITLPAAEIPAPASSSSAS